MERQTINVGMKPPHPGQFIRTEILDELGLSIEKASRVLGIRRATLSDLINEKSSLTPEMAMRIELAFDVKAETLLRMQVWYDTELMRSKADQLNVQRYSKESV